MKFKGALSRNLQTSETLSVRWTAWLPYLSLFLKSEKLPALLYVGKGPEYRPFRALHPVPSAYWPWAQISNHSRACTQALILYKNAPYFGNVPTLGVFTLHVKTSSFLLLFFTVIPDNHSVSVSTKYNKIIIIIIIIEVKGGKNTWFLHWATT
jgi:hypothetical protein